MDVMLKVTPAGIFTNPVMVLGDGPGDYDFEQQSSLAGSDLSIADAQASEKLADEIDFMDPMRLDWQVSPDGGTIWLGGAPGPARINR